MTAILHFTRDLRLDDNAALAAAANGGRVVPVVILDTSTSAGLRRSSRRSAYYCGALAALERAVARRGGKLIVRRGRTAPTLRALARAAGADSVAWSASYDANGTRSDRDVQASLEEAGLRVSVVHDAPAVTPEETAAERRGYRSFVPYFERWLQTDVVPYDVQDAAFASVDVASEALPTPLELGGRSDLDVACDPQIVREAFERYLESEILHYAIARTMPADGHTSQLGAALSFGVIGARSVVAAVRNRRNDRLLLTEERISLGLYLRALAQRDFFLQLAYFYEASDDAPLQEKMRRFQFSRAHLGLDAWRSGRTGYPIVDAGMRQLRATGWMHPRVRSIAASFLCFDLGVDWRVGRDEWDRWLTEDEPALATGNWQWIAGVGADMAAYPRIYNPRTQARRCDPSGRYIRRWLPELASRSDRTLFEPDAEARQAQLSLSLFGDAAYPAPVVDHDRAAHAFLERYKREISVASERES
ncbi:MAG: deoxyribodipyrimidine photo-lyase [Candidatus Eremiobacteraeota bacterium]|nr:deoxyribodipyrimidine photo-lyase [Candidatus Eremiobacteraeota bacterium]